MKTQLSVSLIVLALAVLGCQPAADQVSPKEYEVNGKVTAVDAEKQTITLDHEEIPGLMTAMEMEFKVENAGLVSGINVGDQVHAHLQVKSGEQILTHLEKQ